MKHLDDRAPWRAAVVVAMSLLALAVTPGARAATVAGGSLTLNLDRNALITNIPLDTFPDTPTAGFQICCRPSIYLEEFFDSAAAASRTFAQIRDDNTPDLYDLTSDEIPATGLQFAVNAPQVTNLAGRINQPTNFTFDRSNILGTATGNIGLGGVMRFRIDTPPPNNRVMLGDMSLEYHPELEGATPGRSGWLLVNHVGFTADAFELFDVSTLLTGNSLTLNGSLGFGWGFDHLGAGTARAAQTRIGTFSLQTTVVPVPAAVWLFAGGLAGLFASGRSRKIAV